MRRGWVTKFFGLEPRPKHDFELLCKAGGLNQSEVINDLVAGFLKENEGQTTLAGFPHQEEITESVFNKASLFLAREELGRLITLIEKNADDESRRRTFQLDLAKALRVVEPVYRRTRDDRLTQLMKRAESSLE